MPDAQTLVDYGMYPYWNNYRALDDPWMYIWGRADYEDIFKRPHFVESYNETACPFEWTASEVHQKRLKPRFADQ